MSGTGRCEVGGEGSERVEEAAWRGGLYVIVINCSIE